jgi:Rrf2 family protein
LVLEVCRHGGKNRPVNLTEVSKVTGISKKFLEQLAIALKSHSILRGVAGRKGGYLLARPPEDITIGEVLTAVSGPTCLTFCVDDPSYCISADFCECRLVWRLLSLRVQQVLDEYTIADLSDMERVCALREEVLTATESHKVRANGPNAGARPDRSKTADGF